MSRTSRPRSAGKGYVMLSDQFEISQFQPPPLLGYDLGDMSRDDDHARQPSQPEMPRVMPPPERRDENDQRANDHLFSLLEAMREAQAHGLEQLGTQIGTVAARLETLSTKGNEAAIENVRTLTRLEGRLEATEKANAGLLVEIGALKGKVEPLQFAYAKFSALAAAMAGGATLGVEALDLFNRHAGK